MFKRHSVVRQSRVMSATTNHNLDHEWPQREVSNTYKMKPVLSQLCATLAIFALNFTYMGFLSLGGVQDSPDTQPLEYFGTITCAGLLVGGVVAQILGGRMIMMLGGATLTGGWLICGWISSIEIVRWVVLFVMGTIQAPGYVYVAEISQPKLRNTLVGMVYLSVVSGSCCRSYLTQGVAAKTIAAVFPFLGLILMFFLPDSPYWLANKGRYHEVESSLAWYRGWTTSANVKSETTEIISNAKSNPAACRFFGRKSLYIAALIVCHTFIIQAFMNDFHFMYDYTRTELTEMTDELTAFLIIDVLFEALISIAFLIFVTVIDKRNTILISLLGASIALFAVSLFNHLRENAVTYAYVYNLLFAIFVTVTHVFITAGIMPIPTLLNGELFLSRLRNVGAGFGLFFGRVFIYISLRSFGHFFVVHLGIDDLFIVLAVTGIFGFCTLLWLFPRNENKSLVAIERDSNSILSLRRKKFTELPDNEKY